ncbi:MAG TPA: hypothetical protein VNR38_21860 [Ureibacillus sp.]|nr:hypothetical protein [Ureibacillus sp.]
MEEIKFAELDVEQLEKINRLQEELGVVLIAYDKRMNSLPDEELANHDDQLS